MAYTNPSVMLWDQIGFASRFEELLSSATALDVGVAWITSEELTDRILAFASVAGHATRIVTGVSDYLTDGAALFSANTRRPASRLQHTSANC